MLETAKPFFSYRSFEFLQGFQSFGQYFHILLVAKTFFGAHVFLKQLGSQSASFAGSRHNDTLLVDYDVSSFLVGDIVFQEVDFSGVSVCSTSFACGDDSRSRTIAPAVNFF